MNNLTLEKITAEARKHLITKSTADFSAYLFTISKEDGKQSYEKYTISGSFDTDMEIMVAICGRYTDAQKVVAPMTDRAIEKIETRYAMFDDDFFADSTIVRQDTKTAGNMVRTLTVNTLHFVQADFETKTFEDRSLPVIGNFENARDCLNWIIKRYPDLQDKAVGKPEIVDTYEIKCMMNIDTFFENAFMI